VFIIVLGTQFKNQIHVNVNHIVQYTKGDSGGAWLTLSNGQRVHVENTPSDISLMIQKL
jgi:hypothetical protein